MKFSINIYPHIKDYVDAMSVEQLLKTVICPDCPADAIDEGDLTSVFFYATTADKSLAASRQMNEGREHKALVVSDMEYGAHGAVIGATEFPSMKAAAVAGDERDAYLMGEIAAKEAISAGYHWTFGPCVDLLTNEYSPAVAYRTAGADPDTVIKYCGAYMEGLQDNGLIATLKHFPGDGGCIDDQHITLPENTLSEQEWRDSFGRVYSELINRGAMAVMPGHIALPCLDEPDENGIYPPATVSKRLLTDILKNELGFDGIIVSDAVNMAGFCGYMNLYEASSAFLEAGGDCLLFMHGTEEYYSEMKNCIERGLLSLETLRSRALRMLCFAYQYFEKHNHTCVDFDRNHAESVAKRISENAVKITRDRASLLPYPITADKKIAHVVIHNVWSDISVTDELQKKLSSIAKKVDTFDDPGPGKLLQIAKSRDYDLIVCSVIESPSWGINTSKLSGPAARNMMNGWTRFGTKTLFISYNSPSFGRTYNASVDTLIETHGITKYTVDKVIRLITE